MEGTGIIGAIALIIIFMFVCMLVFIIKLILDVRVYKYKQKDEHKPAFVKEENKMYLIEKPQKKQKEKEYMSVSPKKIYTIDEKK